MISANVDHSFSKHIRMNIASYLSIKDALKMTLLSSKESRNFANSALARGNRKLKLSFTVLSRYFSRRGNIDDTYQRMIEKAVDLSSKIHISLSRTINFGPKQYGVMVYFFGKLP